MNSISPVITLEDISLTLPSLAGPVHILKSVSLSVTAGQSVALVGASGSGKSSLMAIMAGLERATSGRATIAGQDFSALDEDGLALARRGRIGIILQAFHLMPTMTALENVAIPLELAGRADAFAAARQELSAVGLANRTEHYPAQLSGGEQQRVAIARAAATRPAILFADEPTGNLDMTTGASIIDLLMDLHSTRKTTLVLITHDAALANRCERQLHMVDGRLS